MADSGLHAPQPLATVALFWDRILNWYSVPLVRPVTVRVVAVPGNRMVSPPIEISNCLISVYSPVVGGGAHCSIRRPSP